ncbi:MAG TPA: hypothetical protein VFM17_02460 [Candidatus Eisenbacteria bacterium]|nr:hypothetical protein [Candidatus Eisenbacteria bacterium]
MTARARRAAAAALAAALLAASSAGAATRLFVVNHVASNDVRAAGPWAGRLALATAGGLVLADTASLETAKLLRASSGIPSDNLLSIAESPAGYLWIGTADRGLSRLRPDGTFLRTLTSFDGIPSDRVQAILRSGDSLWVATNGGVALFAENPANGQFSLRRSDSQASTAGGIVSDDVTSLAVWGDTLWAGTAAGLSVYAGGTWTPRTAITAARVQALLVARDTLWIGTKTGLLVYAGGAASLRGSSVETLSLGTHPEGVARGSVTGPLVERADGTEFAPGTGGLPTPRVQAILSTASGRVFAGTNGGLARYVGGTPPWEPVLSPGPIANGGVRIAANAHGAWVTLGNVSPPGYVVGALLHYDGRDWRAITSAGTGGQLQQASLFGILAARDGRIWLGHCCSNNFSDGRPRVDRWDPAADVWDRPQAYNIFGWTEGPGSRVTGVGVEYEQGVYFFDASSGALLDSLTPTNTAGGLTRENLRDAAYDAQGRGWFATADNGVDRWAGQGTDTRADDVWTHFATGFPSLQTTSVAAVSATDVWVGTRAGAVRIVNDLLDLAAMSRVNSILAGAGVNDLAIDSERGVWIASSAGLLRVAATGTVESFDVDDGLASTDVLGLAWDDGRDVLWALTAGGVSEVHPGFGDRFSFDDGSYLYPNPVGPSSAPVRLGGISGEVRGEIRDLSGARVRGFRADPASPEFWDLRDDGGNLVAPGVYLVVLRQGDFTRVLRVAVTR